jgi:hypothetical protein
MTEFILGRRRHAWTLRGLAQADACECMPAIMEAWNR